MLTVEQKYHKAVKLMEENYPFDEPAVFYQNQTRKGVAFKFRDLSYGLSPGDMVCLPESAQDIIKKRRTPIVMIDPVGDYIRYVDQHNLWDQIHDNNLASLRAEAALDGEVIIEINSFAEIELNPGDIPSGIHFP